MHGLKENSILERIGRRDHTVWGAEPQGIADRLGWIDIATRMRPELPRLNALRASARADGFRRALLVGMGGSSLAPEVLAQTFGTADGGLNLEVLDTTHPDVVRSTLERLDPATTLIIVATKSGGTVETLSLFKAAYSRALSTIGAESAGRCCLAITDPGSSLEDLGRSLGFREILLSDPDIGGRYSALSHFGMAPAALIGADVDTLVERGIAASDRALRYDDVASWLGASIATLAAEGRDKLTLVLPDEIASFGYWIEQLVAESTGKDGIGILPVVGEPMGAPGEYRSDRVFVRLQLAAGQDADSRPEAIEDAGQDVDSHLEAIADAGHPTISLGMADRLDLGAQFVIWEVATAIAGHLLGVQPFDQPDVEAAKVRARTIIENFKSTSHLPEDGSVSPDSSAIARFFEGAGSNDGAYVAIQAFLNPTAEVKDALDRLREAIRDAHRLAVTIGFGPRFLHSTGQIHKGDGGRGLFLQLTADPTLDLDIPDEPGGTMSALSFGTLIRAQALGDAGALQAAGRRVLRIALGSEIEAAAAIARLASQI